MSLYTHFPSKRALIEAVVDQVAGDIELPDLARLEWQEGMAEVARSIRRHQRSSRRPGFGPERAHLGPNALLPGEYSYSLMQRAGFSDQAMVDAVGLFLINTLAHLGRDTLWSGGALA